MSKWKGFFVFEGIDGSGKTTVSKRIAERLKEKNQSVVWHREPTDGNYGKKIRSFLSGQATLSPKEQLELFVLDRIESVNSVILPHLEKGSLIIQDRYYYSTAAYQGGKDLSAEEILSLNENKGFPKPTQVFFLDLTPEEAKERRKYRGGTEEAFDEDKEQNRIYANYMKILPENTVFLDATQSIESLLDAIQEIIEGEILS